MPARALQGPHVGIEGRIRQESTGRYHCENVHDPYRGIKLGLTLRAFSGYGLVV